MVNIWEPKTWSAPFLLIDRLCPMCWEKNREPMKESNAYFLQVYHCFLNVCISVVCSGTSVRIVVDVTGWCVYPWLAHAPRPGDTSDVDLALWCTPAEARACAIGDEHVVTPGDVLSPAVPDRSPGVCVASAVPRSGPLSCLATVASSAFFIDCF